MTNDLSSILPSVAILGAAAIVALHLSISRGWVDADHSRLGSAARLAMIVILAQAVHFTEELYTGFHERFPALFGLPPMSLRVFVSFNVVWLVIWGIGSWGLSAGHRAALFPIWFLAIGCVLNAVGHPLLSVYSGGYFPGLVTSPVVGVLGILLLRRLLSITHAADLSPTQAGPHKDL